MTLTGLYLTQWVSAGQGSTAGPMDGRKKKNTMAAAAGYHYEIWKKTCTKYGIELSASLMVGLILYLGLCLPVLSITATSFKLPSFAENITLNIGLFALQLNPSHTVLATPYSSSSSSSKGVQE